MPENKDKITPSIIEAHVSLHGKTVLEIGCGDGRVTRYLAGAPKLLVAFDPSLAVLEHAKQAAPAANYLTASGLDLPFAHESFDVVFFTLSLHHHPDCAVALAEAQRVLRTGGNIVVMEPLNDGELEQICNVLNDEGAVLADAQAAIDGSSLQVVGTEIFTTEWHMENTQELVDWLFDHYAVPFDQAIVDRIMGLLGDKGKDAPLILDDETKLTCLSK